ncbi:hypothetical protein ACFSMW_07570 [Virgibacillus halophilus]|uniref:Uncharacterized protein n=1 Tax=Tigheibacillus halophilus TaxID=361280 RepID=A0ABU5C7E0_9BACI|nr:hypothetical protein [Virgibacillus halophilus]
MWIITRYEDTTISMFEYKTEQEAREALKTMKGSKILSEVGCLPVPHTKRNAA